MEFLDIVHNPGDDPISFGPDVFIAASGYESRSTAIPRKVEGLDCRKVAITFTEYSKELQRPENDKYFKSQGFEMLPASGFEIPDYSKVLLPSGSDKLKVLIDISVMTRTWYHGLLKYIVNLPDNKQISLRVVYCPAENVHAVKLRKSLSINYLNMVTKSGKSIDDRPTALLLGLGHEQDIARRLHEIIRPDRTKLLYADPEMRKEYVEKIFITNHSLINRTDIKELFAYPMHDTSVIYSLLVDLIMPLRKDYRVIIIPQGPKIFSLISMIVQLSYPDIELAYPKYKIRQIRDRKPFSEFTTIDLFFGKE